MADAHPAVASPRRAGTKRKRSAAPAQRAKASPAPAPASSYESDDEPLRRGSPRKTQSSTSKTGRMKSEPEQDPVSVEEPPAKPPSPKKAKAGRKVTEEVKVEPKASPPKLNNSGGSWETEDTNLLLERIQCNLPNTDHCKYTTMADKMDWGAVCFRHYNADQCKVKWLDITTKLRRFRTMTELLQDAREWAKMPWNSFGKKQTKHPDMPKKPLTPYFRYFIAKRERYAKKHPELAMTDLSKLLSEKFRNLPEAQKQLYNEEYNRENDTYKVAFGKFKEDHPELYKPEPSSHPVKTAASPTMGKPPKATTPMMIYINIKAKEQVDKGSNFSRKELYEHYRSKWGKLSGNKKLKYINKAIEAKNAFDDDMKEFCDKHPEFKPKDVKTFLSKAESKIKDQSEGKPEKPPPNGYGIFTALIIPTLQDTPSIERMQEVSRQWKVLPEEQRAGYNQDSEKKNIEYKALYQRYLSSLPEDVRQKMEEDEKKKQSKRQSSTPVKPAQPEKKLQGSKRPQKPVAAVFIWNDEKKAEYRKKHPELGEKELNQLLVKEFNCLHDKEKAKYEKRATAEREKLKVLEKNSSKSGSNKNKPHFPGEPRKPATSAYQLYSASMLASLTDIPSKERMQEVSRRWGAMTDKDKKDWNKKKEALNKQYLKDLKKFKMNMSPKDRKRYEDAHKPRPKKSKKKSVPWEESSEEEKVTPEVEEAEEEEEEDDEEEEGEEEKQVQNGQEDEDGDEEESSDEDEDSSSSEDSSDDSDSDAEVAEDEKQLVNGNKSKAKTGKLNAKDVYADESEESASSDSSDSESESDSD